MEIRGILFDKDGTLFDFHATWVPVFRDAALHLANGDSNLAHRMLRAGGYNHATEQVRPGSVLAAGHTVELAAIWGAFLPDVPRSELVASLDGLFADGGLSNAVPATDLPDLFNDLRTRGFALGVATNDAHATAQLMLSSFSVSHLIDFLAGYDSGHGAKPEPGMATAFCEKAGLDAAEVMVVGDSTHDMQMGRRANLGAVIGVLTGPSEVGDLKPMADHVLDSVADLPAWLDGA